MKHCNGIVYSYFMEQSNYCPAVVEIWETVARGRRPRPVNSTPMLAVDVETFDVFSVARLPKSCKMIMQQSKMCNINLYRALGNNTPCYTLS